MPHKPEKSAYQGRPLPRPHEDLEDQGLAFDVGTLLQRRQLLKAFGIGGLTLALTACGAASEAGCGEIPDETAGPYPGDGSNGPDVLEQSGIVRSDIRSSFGESSGTAEGIPMTLELRITDLANGGAPFAGVAVYVWHCTREGLYSMYSEGVEDQNYLRGVQIADADGVVRFSSIFPACYSGRWPHIHFEVYPDEASITDSANAIATSQVALPEEACKAVYATAGYETSVRNLAQVTLASDSVFGDDGGASQLGKVTGSVEQGYSVSLTAGVDTRTEPGGGMGGPAGGDAPGAGMGGPGGAGGPGGEPPAGGAPGGSAPAGGPPAAP
ncbi:intradiol ring-cleavage dioxygenase [Arthrobacter sp. BL-252-APC-1A]|uniref:intradiol ring-cleavage dioxygenase n=1 Tax=Arthrobacter sp. BL-252-APC-1A TaxID=2606622 RepID=UPI0012B44050|nr:intradiol ring-cleavage dioxygenase [Arthrobacter sp. BL-252-APC-1A]MSR99430.1 intradiol ring-cleavage dioxygenase [Arthrobacter sp. BL-252-APC-1A]